jgi:hypothetical protein
MKRSIKPRPGLPGGLDVRAYANLPLNDKQMFALLMLLHHAGFGAMCVERAILGIDRVLEGKRVSPGILEAARATYGLWHGSKPVRQSPPDTRKRRLPLRGRKPLKA